MLGYYSSLSSEVYDMDKPVGHSFGDVEFYIDRLSSVEGNILEPATGTPVSYVAPLREISILFGPI